MQIFGRSHPQNSYEHACQSREERTFYSVIGTDFSTLISTSTCFGDDYVCGLRFLILTDDVHFHCAFRDCDSDFCFDVDH